jgi:uncharacterized protein with PIN domain
MKLLCDEMLGSLARWLRAAGYDTALAPPGTGDGALLAQCAQEERLLITRDRALAKAALADVATVLLPEGSLDAHARRLAADAGIDWMLAPFTRCIADNAVLVDAPNDKLEVVPPPFRAGSASLRFCPTCWRVYWPGGHVQRMAAQLQQWQSR